MQKQVSSWLWCWLVIGCLQEHLFLVCELLRANLYEFQKYNREHGQEPYFTLPRVQSIARQVGHCNPIWTRGEVRSSQADLLATDRLPNLICRRCCAASPSCTPWT